MTGSAASSLVAIDLISDNKDLRFEVAGRIAEAILELKRTQGHYMPQDLSMKGFTASELAENWNAAHFLIAINGLETWG